MASLAVESRAKSGVAWRYAAYFVSQVLRVATTTFLAAKLAPEAFGLVALVNVVITGFSMVTEAGISQSIVRDERGEECDFIDTAWTLRMIRGVLVAAGVIAAAWPMARFYDAPPLMLLLPFAALTPLIGGLQSPAWDLMSRELRERPRAIIELSRALVASFVKVGWVIVAPSAWALVGGTLAGTIYFVLVTHAFGGLRLPRFSIEQQAAGAIWRFGRWLILGSIVAFLARQADRLAVGRLEAMGVLGVLSIGQTLARIPLEIAATGTGHVLFPAVSEILRDSNRGRGAERRVRLMREGMLRIAGAMVLGAFVVLPMFVELVYSGEYERASVWGRLALVGVWVMILNAGVNASLLAAGHSGQLAFSGAIGLVTGLPGGLVGYHVAGVEGLVLGFAVGPFSSHLRDLFVASRLGLRFGAQDVGMTIRVVAGVFCVIIIDRVLASLSGEDDASVSAKLTLLGLVSLYCLRESICGWRRIGWYEGKVGS